MKRYIRLGSAWPSKGCAYLKVRVWTPGTPPERLPPDHQHAPSYTASTGWSLPERDTSSTYAETVYVLPTTSGSASPYWATA